jgi:mycothiol system anti-sigma-R factor
VTADRMPDCGPDCQRALERLEAFLDGELAAEEVGSISSHLGDCHPCSDRASFEEQVRALVRSQCLEAAPPELLRRVKARLESDVTT